MQTLNISYKSAYTSSIEFETQINEKETGREQRYPKKIYPKRTFTLTFEKDSEARTELEDFFETTKGASEKFYWAWESSKGGNDCVYECFFDVDSLDQAIQHLGYSECELKLITIDRSAISASDNLDFYYNTDHSFSKTFSTIKDKIFTAQQNTRSMWDSEKKAWILEFEKNQETRIMLEDFFIAKKGKFKSFNWTWDSSKGGDGNTYTVRFDTDKLESEINYFGYGKLKLPIKEVWPSVSVSQEVEKDEIVPRKLLKISISSGSVLILDNDTMESLDFNDETYLGAPLEVGEITHDDNNEVAKVNLSISNTSQAISGIIGQNGDVITGSDCYLYRVFLDTTTNTILDEFNELLYAGKANNLQLSNTLATMDIESSLGGFEQTAPKMNYGVSCQWGFKDVRCGYFGHYENCDKTLTTCKNYGNELNFGGFPSMPAEQVIKA